MREWLVRNRTHHKTGKQRNSHILFLLRMICVFIELLLSPEVHRVIMELNLDECTNRRVSCFIWVLRYNTYGMLINIYYSTISHSYSHDFFPFPKPLKTIIESTIHQSFFDH